MPENPKGNRYHIIWNDGAELCIDGTHHEIKGDWLYVYAGEIQVSRHRIRGGLMKDWWFEKRS